MEFQRLRVSADGRHIEQEDGTPFFYLADTAWEIFFRLSREEAALYLDARAEAGFTAMQVMALAEHDGIRQPNAHGRRPFKKGAGGEWDSDLPDLDGGYSYWDHADWIIGEAEKRGLYVALLPTWGDKFNIGSGAGPELFRPDSAYRYGKWIASRYSGRPNIIWVMGGDRPLENRRHFETVCEMARGIREICEGRQLMTFHPAGGRHSSDALHEEPWLDFNMIQSGHTRSRHNYEMIARDYALCPPKPIIDGEPGYEDHPEGFDPKNGYLDAADARQFMYMALLSGACGHTYGNHSVWGFVKALPVEGFQPAHFCLTWDKAMRSPGAAQMRHGKNLMLSRDFLGGAPRPDLVDGQLGGALHVPVLKGADYLMAYTSHGLPIRFAPGFMGGAGATSWWYDPRTGAALSAGSVDDARDLVFAPPSGGRGNDWVFVADAAGAGYGEPGAAKHYIYGGKRA